MHIRILTIATLLAFCVPATADFTTISRAYEIPLDTFSVPVTQNGTITVKECQECEAKSGRLTPQTQFRINGRSVELKEFRKSAFGVRDRAAETVIVLHHLESDTISSISLNL